MSHPLFFFGSGPNGMLFTDGEKLYLVMESVTVTTDNGNVNADMRWSGLRVESPSAAFHDITPNPCGAEVDMRQNDESPMDEATMAIGDQIADALNRYYRDEEKRLCREWAAMQKTEAHNANS